ncbi:MAG: hypothetical protein QM723_25520 [Myxococcaceae bacterium]
MTKKKTLKDRVRARQQKTGERYTTALAQVRAKGDEPHDLTALAQQLGFTCNASAHPRLPHALLPKALETLKSLLLALGSDPGAANMAAVVLHGDRGAPVSANGIAELTEARGFLGSGRRGVSSDGRLATFKVEDRTVIATVLWHSTRPAFLYLAPLEARAESGWSEVFPLAGIGG